MPEAEGGYKYLLTIVDRFSRWPEAYPLRDMASQSCARDFIQNWLPRFGIPDTLVTDRGSQFVGGAWKELMCSLGISTLQTTAYHPQCNGLVERMHRQLKGAIRARLTSANWCECLPLVLLGLRSAWRSGPEASPSQLLYGTMLRLPGEFVPAQEIQNSSPNHVSSFVSSFQKMMREQRSAPSLHHPSSLATFVPKDLKKASMVLMRHDGVKKPLQNPYDGPFPVLEHGDKVFKILKNGLPYTVSVDRLKACNMPLTPPLSSMIPNTSPPPPHPAESSTPLVKEILPLPSTSSSALPSVPLGPDSSVGVPSSPDITSPDDFPVLPPPLYTASGRRSKPRIRLDL